MSTCAVSQNQPIVQALLDRAASYPADKPYQAKAYKKAAESVAAYNLNLYEISEIYPDKLPGVGLNIEGFIYDFIDNTPVTAQPVAPVSEPVVVNEPVKACTNPTNQSIYQALLDRAASYPADKPYQAKAYKRAAESVLNYNKNFYDCIIETIPGIGQKIEEFIDDFVASNPLNPIMPEPVLTGAAKAMDDARKAAAANQPKDITAWPNDAVARAAFQAKVEASKVIESAPVQEAFNQLRTAIGLPPKPVEPPKPLWSWADYLERMKPIVYTAENPRRSKRLVSKPKVEYFPKDNDSDSDSESEPDGEYDEDAEDVFKAIKAYCIKKNLKYSASFPAEFNAWLPTADQIAREKYNYKTNKYIPRTKPEMVKEWAQYYSTSLKQQQKEKKLSKALIKYCEKNNIEYQEVMDDKFATWMADPANKKLITYTYKSSNSWLYSSCNPNSIKREVQEYTYNRSDTYCINKWFSTLKKTIVW
jgi:DNA polymerase/3'-5' exonuclease PolX